MMEDKDRPVGPRRTVAANDNGTVAAKIDAAVLRIACLLGRQIAREEFERQSVANDNRPVPVSVVGAHNHLQPNSLVVEI